MPTFAECDDVARRHGSPFYVFDDAEFAANFRGFERAFRSRWDRVQIGYSYKTNYLPWLCRLAKDLGGYAEVVSRLEYDHALRLGHDPSTIIFNGPLKTAEDLDLALGRGSLVNLDAPYELDHVRSLARRRGGAPVRVGLRVNMDLADEEGTSHVQQGLEVGRFGFAPESIPEIASILRADGVDVRSLHGHTSSTTRSTWIFERITATLCRLAEEVFPETVDDVNVGGGYFGKLPPGFGPADAPSFDDYAEAIVGTLRRSAWARRRRPRLVLEPGVALAANTLSFVTRVVDVKEIRGRLFAVVDGSVFNVKPSMHRRNQPFQVIAPQGCGDRRERVVSVVGATCMEKDRLLEDVPCAVERGDWLKIDNVGAYTIVMTPPFIHPAPAIVVRRDRELTPVRSRQTFDQVFGAYLFPPADGEGPR